MGEEEWTDSWRKKRSSEGKGVAGATYSGQSMPIPEYEMGPTAEAEESGRQKRKHSANRYMDVVEIALICVVYMHQPLDRGHLLDLAGEHCWSVLFSHIHLMHLWLPSHCNHAHCTPCHHIILNLLIDWSTSYYMSC